MCIRDSFYAGRYSIGDFNPALFQQSLQTDAKQGMIINY
jgi:hypothetical protein